MGGTRRGGLGNIMRGWGEGGPVIKKGQRGISGSNYLNVLSIY